MSDELELIKIRIKTTQAEINKIEIQFNKAVADKDNERKYKLHYDLISLQKKCKFFKYPNHF